MKKHTLLFVFLLFSINFLSAQNTEETTKENNNAESISVSKSTEFSIPVSPAFDLMGVNPSQVIKPTNIREFKVDWSFRSWRLKPNLALQVQPIWEMFYNRATLNKYQKANYLMKTLSSLDISAGTVEDEDFSRRVSVAAKINLYRQYDPLDNRELFEAIDYDYQTEQMDRMKRINQIKALVQQQKKRKAVQENLLVELDSLKNEYNLLETEQKEKVQDIAQNFIKNHWNAAHLDVAYGQIFSYDRPRLDSLNLKAQAQAVWVNGSIGIGKKVLLTGLARYILQVGDLVNVVKDTTTMMDTSIITNRGLKGNVFSLGLNFRYGSPKFNFFAEYVYSNGSNKIAISDNALNITQVGKFSMAYGGDWRINRNVMISYGVRTDYTDGFKFKNLIPVAGISCMMR